jgi:hypothetical protein
MNGDNADQKMEQHALLGWLVKEPEFGFEDSSKGETPSSSTPTPLIFEQRSKSVCTVCGI